MSMIYEEVMNYILSVGRFGFNYGFERIFRFLEFIGNLYEKIKLIYIVGINGKGFIIVMIIKILRGFGYKVGMYIFFYLEEFEERI